MNCFRQIKPFYKVAIVVTGIVLVLLGIQVLGSPSPDSAQLLHEMTLEPEGSYDPIMHGLPRTVAGYTVLAVLTPQNTACMRSGTKRLVLQASEPDVHSLLANNRAAEVNQMLRRIEDTQPFDWQVEIVGPSTTREQILSGSAEWNANFQHTPCLKLGPINTVEPQE